MISPSFFGASFLKFAPMGGNPYSSVGRAQIMYREKKSTNSKLFSTDKRKLCFVVLAVPTAKTMGTDGLIPSVIKMAPRMIRHEEGGAFMLKFLKKEANKAETENGAVTYRSTESDCLDFFSSVGALRSAEEERILTYFKRALAENADTAIKILFYARDIRGGLGERRIFRIILKFLAQSRPDTVHKNLKYIEEYGRFDDLLMLLETPCQTVMVNYINEQLKKDMEQINLGGEYISLLAKWLPSVNASNKNTVKQGKILARLLGMKESIYRKTLSKLRHEIAIIENSLRNKDYTFSYERQPSRAMYKYRKAFIRNDSERYMGYISCVSKGEVKLNTGTLYPYDMIAPLLNYNKQMEITEDERKVLDASWNSLADYTNGENALAVVDGSGSMYQRTVPSPISVALSLGIYFGERNEGIFQNHFITFSKTPQLVEIKGRDITEKVEYCASFNEVANTNLKAVFLLILSTAVKNHLSQEEMPKKLYIISDMEFDDCAEDSSLTNFEFAQKEYQRCGYHLPQVVFWNVASRSDQQPVRRNEQGVALVSGASPRLFQMISEGKLSPYEQMIEIIDSARYEMISA